MARAALLCLVAALPLHSRADASIDYGDDGVGAAVRRQAKELRDAGKHTQAAALLKSKLAEIRDAGSKPSHLQADLLDDLAVSYAQQGKKLEALAAAEEAADMVRAVEGEKSPRFGLALDRLADAHIEVQENRQAASLLADLRENLLSGLGASHPAYRSTLRKLGDARMAIGHHKAARKAFSEWLELLKASSEGSTVEAGVVHLRLSRAMAATGSKLLPDALKHAERAYEIHEATPEATADTMEHAFSANAVAGVLERLDRDDEAVAAMERAHDIVVQDYGQEHPICQQAERHLLGLKAKVARKTKARDE